MISLRSIAVSRRRRMAFADLKQIGCHAKIATFEKLWLPVSGNKDRLRDETKRIMLQDRQTAQEREQISPEERMKLELMDAFIGIVSAYTLSQIGNNGESAASIIKRSESNVLGNEYVSVEIGRLGFKRLILDGKLLGLPKGTADACYESVDADGSGCVSFKEVWIWFSHQAKIQNFRKPGSVQFVHTDIFPAKERAILALMKRFGNPELRKKASRREDDVHDDW